MSERALRYAEGLDEHLRFVFLTGVSKFSKVSLFSGLNNLTDITLDARWSACAATPMRTSTPSSHRSCPDSTATRSAAGTTATTGSAPGSTTPTTCSTCSKAGVRCVLVRDQEPHPSWSSCWLSARFPSQTASTAHQCRAAL
ncbi:hypothetical protein EWH46_00015 (plasmid) [Sphaerotilus sulfidivorans]|uniref:Uncharacterized protein n=1 Tax=Sphaerotilus sulfidivorans TaxID=639200 RepID=A0A5C1PXE3_9BURK|nr:hypothetical protein EWH46_00015 [Sphaerotilus sulfidivorans]